MYKYLFHGSVGIDDNDGGDLVRDYEDVEVPYESKRPLDPRDGPDCALAYMCVKDAYVSKLLEQGLGYLVNENCHVDVLSCGLTEVTNKPFLEPETTERGFRALKFIDVNDQHCSLQESSSAEGAKIWFGINKVEPKYLVPGQGWKVYRLPEHFMMNGRMHLNQDQVRELLPHLQKFANTGEL